MQQHAVTDPSYYSRFWMGPVLTMKHLLATTKLLARNLDIIVTLNNRTTSSYRNLNMRSRAIGINVQGFADILIAMGIPMESTDAARINLAIAETVYYGALSASCELAELHGRCDAWAGCPADEGFLQYELWEITPSAIHNWASLKTRIAEHGLRNLLSVTLSSIPVHLNISGVISGVNPIER